MVENTEPKRIARLQIEELEPRIAPISDQGLNAIATHRPFNPPPDVVPPPVGGVPG